MILSDEQMRAVRYGEHNLTTWEWVDLPVGRQPLPAASTWISPDLPPRWFKGDGGETNG